MDDQFSLDDSEDLIKLRSAWERVLQRLSGQAPEAMFKRFIQPLKPESIQAGRAKVVAPSSFVHEWVTARFLTLLQISLGDELGEPVLIDVVVEAREKPQIEPEAAYTALTRIEERAPFRPNDKYRFETFIPGPSNQLALNGARAVAEQPGTTYNPLFVYSPPGLGKTHLLHSIGHVILERNPQAALAYISGQQFAEDFIQALHRKNVEEFRRAQRSASIWLVDDIQFVAGKVRTQEEVFHTFNCLHSAKKQIVLCSDRPPRELPLIDERLRSRFESSLVADIQPPDTQTRCSILLSKASLEGIDLAENVALHLAAHVPGNVRVLEGALTKLVAQASILGKPLNLELAKEMVETYYSKAGFAKPSLARILDAVSKHFSIPMEDIRGQSRKAPIAHARHVAVYITRTITGDSWNHIGGQFGNRDHTSMIHSYQRASEMMAEDRELYAAVHMLMRNLCPEL